MYVCRLESTPLTFQADSFKKGNSKDTFFWTREAEVDLTSLYLSDMLLFLL